MKLDSTISDFLSYLQNNKALNKNSIKVYYSALKHLKKINFSEQYLVELKNNLSQKYSNTYLRYIFTIIKSFWRWCIKKGYTKKYFPEINIKTPKTLKPFLMPDTLQKVLEMCPKKYEIYYRLMAYAGLRLSEAINVNPINIIPKNNHIILTVIGKGNKQRQVPIYDKKTIELLKTFDSSNKVTGRTLQYHLNKIKKELQIPTLTPHILRHSFASILYNQGIPLDYIQKLLGHENIKTTQIYAKLTTEQLEKALQQVKF